jgi:hypothetical protein
MKQITHLISPKNSIILIGALIFTIILLLILNSPEKLLYDEPYFIKNLNLLLDNGLTKSNLFFYESQAPGPLFQLVYYFIFKYFGIKFTIVKLRVFNFIFFNLGIFYFLKTFKSPCSKTFWTTYFSVFSIPFIYPVFGLGLTECTSMFFISLALYSLMSQKNIITNSLVYVISLALAMLGRQTFIVIIPAIFLCLYLSKFTFSKKILFSLLTIFSLVPILYVINIWGGLVPPEQSVVSGKSLFSISLQNGLLGIGYSAMTFFILNPILSIEYINKKVVFLSGIIAVITELILKVEYLPVGTFFSKFDNLPTFFSYLFPFLILKLAVIYIYIIIKTIYRHFINQEVKRMTFLILASFMIFTSFKIVHQFSSRYVAQYAFLSLNQEQIDDNKNIIVKVFLLVLGSILGLYSLYSYYSL